MKRNGGVLEDDADMKLVLVETRSPGYGNER